MPAWRRRRQTSYPLIQKYEAGSLALDRLKGAIAAQADRGFVAFRSEQFLQTQANAGIVFDDENARFHGDFWATPGESGRVKRNTLPPPSRGLKVTSPP